MTAALSPPHVPSASMNTADVGEDLRHVVSTAAHANGTAKLAARVRW